MGGVVGGVLKPVGQIVNGVTGGLFGEQGGGGGGYNSAGPKPIRPEFNSLIDPATGLMKKQYINEYGADINPNTQGLEEIRKRALQQGPSSWANLATAQQRLEEKGLKNATQAQGASAEAQARSAMASKFGLSPAAQARLATQNMRSQMSGLQGVGAQGAQARGAIGLQDESMKNQFLQSLPGAENQLAGVQLQNRSQKLGQQNWNTGNAVGQVGLKNAADLSAYQAQLAEYGANRNSDAMRNQSSGGKK